MLLHLILHHSPLRCTCLQVQREGGGSGGPRASQQEGTLGVGSCVLLPLMGVLGGGEYGEIAPHGELRRRLGPGLQMVVQQAGGVSSQPCLLGAEGPQATGWAGLPHHLLNGTCLVALR